MDNKTVCLILGQIYSRLIECSSIDNNQLNVCQSGSLADVNRTELESLVTDLFTEHCRITSLILDVAHLSDAINKFGFIFDNKLNN